MRGSRSLSASDASMPRAFCLLNKPLKKSAERLTKRSKNLWLANGYRGGSTRVCSHYRYDSSSALWQGSFLTALDN
jgi:hypothetical protein